MATFLLQLISTATAYWPVADVVKTGYAHHFAIVEFMVTLYA